MGGGAPQSGRRSTEDALPQYSLDPRQLLRTPPAMRKTMDGNEFQRCSDRPVRALASQLGGHPSRGAHNPVQMHCFFNVPTLAYSQGLEDFLLLNLDRLGNSSCHLSEVSLASLGNKSILHALARGATPIRAGESAPVAWYRLLKFGGLGAHVLNLTLSPNVAISGKFGLSQGIQCNSMNK